MIRRFIIWKQTIVDFWVPKQTRQSEISIASWGHNSVVRCPPSGQPQKRDGANQYQDVRCQVTNARIKTWEQKPCIESHMTEAAAASFWNKAPVSQESGQLSPNNSATCCFNGLWIFIFSDITKLSGIDSLILFQATKICQCHLVLILIHRVKYEVLCLRRCD